jgi:two-component system nitrate/nitrite response regulator NarL
MTQPIRLFVVDDHNLFRRGLIALLSQDPRFEVVGEAGDASAALNAVGRLKPDLILLDNHLPGVSGVQAIGSLKELLPQTRVLMLTVSENEEDLSAGLRAGADGYLLKTIDTADLADSIQRVWEGDSVISPEMLGKLVGLLRRSGPPTEAADTTATPLADAAPLAPASAPLAPDERLSSLSPREREILRLIARGHSNKLIARELDIAETTVKIHVQHILRKLDKSTRVHAAVYATERGLM